MTPTYLNTGGERRLSAYQHVWTRKSKDGWEYEYRCIWSDGSETWECTLPWGDMQGAVELPMTSLRILKSEQEAAQASLETVAALVCASLLAPYLEAAE